MAFKFELLTEAAGEARLAINAVKDGKPWTGTEHFGKATTLVGSFGVNYFGEGGAEPVRVNASPEDDKTREHAEEIIAKAKDSTEAPEVSAGRFLAQADSVIRQATVTRATASATAGEPATPVAALGPVALLLIQAALKKLLPLLFS